MKSIKNLILLLVLITSALWSMQPVLAQEFNPDVGRSDPAYAESPWENFFDGGGGELPPPGNYVYDDGDWVNIGDATLLENVVVEDTPISDDGDIDGWSYDSDDDDGNSSGFTIHDYNNNNWVPGDPYKYYDKEPPYGDMSEADMETVNTLVTIVASSITTFGIGADIAALVDELDPAQLKMLTRFGNAIGLTTAAVSTIQIIADVHEVGEFNANHAMVTASVALGLLAGTSVAAATAAFIGIPAAAGAVLFGGGSLVLGLYAGVSGAGENTCLFGCN